MTIKKPILAVGIGGAGSRLAAKTGDMLGCDTLLIGNGDLAVSPSSPPPPPLPPPPPPTTTTTVQRNAERIDIDTGAVINPTVQLVRAAACKSIGKIRKSVSGHPAVLLIGNLAGRSGCAISPVVLEACKAEGADTISFAIMPFGYEKSRLFPAGVALRRLRESSSCTIVLDNDSLLESNPDLTPVECYKIADAAIMHVVDSLDRTCPGGGTDNLLVASRKRASPEHSLRDALKSLYGSTRPGAVRRSILYVVGGENMPAGMLRSIAELTEEVLGAGNGNSDSRDGFDAPLTTAETVTASSVSSPDEAGVVMLSTMHGMEKFERYDPLGTIIPADRMLDWSTPECSIDCGLDMYQLE